MAVYTCQWAMTRVFRSSLAFSLPLSVTGVEASDSLALTRAKAIAAEMARMATANQTALG